MAFDGETTCVARVQRYHGIPLLLVLLLLAMLPVAQTSAVQWTSQRASYASSICFGRDRFVAVGGNVIRWSTNGLKWFAADFPEGNSSTNLRAVCFSNGWFVAVGWNGVILRSQNGKRWTWCVSPTTRPLRDVYGHNGTFVAVGDYATLLRSEDAGTSWTSMGYVDTPGNPYRIESLGNVTFGNGAWVALEVSQTGGVRSVDGITWNRIHSNNSSVQDLIFDGNRFITVSSAGSSSSISTSLDGLTWQRLTAPRPLDSIAYGKGTYVALGDNDGVLTSTDLVTWTTSITAPGTKALTYAKGAFVGLGNSRIFSKDGTKWIVKARGGPQPDLFSTCFFKSKHYVAGSSGHLSYYSMEEETLIPLASGTTAKLNDIACSDDAIVAVGDGGVVLHSFDGITWTMVDAKTVSNLMKVAYCLGKFCAIGVGGVISTSSDGINWQRPTSNTNQTLVAIATDGTRVIVSGYSQTILRSFDLTTWTRSTGLSENLSALAFGNGVFVGIGSFNSMWHSPDGLQWTARPSGHSGALADVTYGDGWFVMAPAEGDFRVSKDGMNWTPGSAGIDSYVSTNAVRYGGGRFTAVGDYSTIALSQKVPDIARLQPRLEMLDSETLGLFLKTDQAEGVLLDVEYSEDLLTWETVALDRTSDDEGLLLDVPLAPGISRGFFRARPTGWDE